MIAAWAQLFCRRLSRWGSGLVICLSVLSSPAASYPPEVGQVLERYCFDCHADGAAKGGVDFDEFNPAQVTAEDRQLWWRAWRNVRAGLMPPPHKSQPSAAEKALLERWIVNSVWELNPAAPDPGQMTLRRLNRVEYRLTIRDLLGVEFDTNVEFPPDDSGHGFDNIGAVLTVSPLLLEKYVTAAQRIAGQAIPPDGEENASRRNRSRQNFFPRPVPTDPVAQRKYADELLGDFATRAFRRPVDAETRTRLTDLAERIYSQPGETFQSGVRQAVVAVLASPRFLFREEAAAKSSSAAKTEAHPLVDEFTLAARLSYFIWSSMPDAELLRLAGAGQLRANLAAQLKRMAASPKAVALSQNFTGQWLHLRDLEGLALDGREILRREPERKQEELRAWRGGLPPELRVAMRLETEQMFAYVLREDRSLVELLNGRYTFLNEVLARHYGISGVTGRELQRVELPADSPRGGILTHASVLAVTSNPTRTSPVKRGMFILENILGTPPPPPPPNVPPLEDAAKRDAGRKLTLRETLARHREDPACLSCHQRMDPLGLAFENFNALGLWREAEVSGPVDPAGKLITGEIFSGVTELKQLLVEKFARDFYRTVTEKLLTYAVGRGLDYYDVPTVDLIVTELERNGGKPSALLTGIVNSAPFQRLRRESVRTAGKAPLSGAELAATRTFVP